MKETKIFVIPDVHLPNEDKKAVACALQVLRWYKPHTVVLLGDVLDLESVSHWLKDKRKASEGLRLEHEFAAGNAFLDKITPHCRRLVYITGNHERFLEDAIERNPEFDGIIDLDKNLKFAERRKKGTEIVYLPKYGDCWNLGKLWFTHGMFTGQHHASKHVLAYGRSIVYGHVHDVQSFVKVSPIDVDDKHIAISLGCLAKKNPHYMRSRPNNWTHACGPGLVRSDGTFNLDAVIISNGVASYAGRTFKA